MFSSTANRVAPSDGTFTEELRRLKRDGASVLVVGSLQSDQRRDLCSRLFGHASDAIRRRIAVSTTDRAAWRPTFDDESSPTLFRQIDYDAPSRSAVADEPDATASDLGFGDRPGSGESTHPSAHHSPSVATSHADAGTLAELGIAISSAIEYFDTDAGGLEPAELRVGIDSLLPLLEEYDRETVFTFLHLTSGRVTAVDGMCHCHLPVERDATVAAVLSPLFDVVLEVRERTGGYEERWVLQNADRRSHWIPRS